MCEPKNDEKELRRQLSCALNELVAQHLIHNESARCTGIQGTYVLLEPDGVQAAAEAFGLSAQDIHLLKGIASKKKKQ